MNVFFHNDALHLDPETNEEKRALRALYQSVQAWFASHKALYPSPACFTDEVEVDSVPGLSPAEANVPD